MQAYDLQCVVLFLVVTYPNLKQHLNDAFECLTLLLIMSVELDGQLTSLSNSENEAYKLFVEFASLLDIFILRLKDNY